MFVVVDSAVPALGPLLIGDLDTQESVYLLTLALKRHNLRNLPILSLPLGFTNVYLVAESIGFDVGETLVAEECGQIDQIDIEL